VLSEAVAAPAPDIAALHFEGGADTALGGVLYLLNAMDVLDLPSCFEPTCRLASAVGFVGTLEALARGLLAGEDSHPADPIWALLSALDRRATGIAPRADGLRVDSLRLPAAWLEPLAGEIAPLRAGAHGERIVLFAAAGFPLVDVRGSPGTAEELARSESQRLGLEFAGQIVVTATDPVEARPPFEGWPPALVRWTSFVVPFLRYRLARALGAPAGGGFSGSDALLTMPARLHATDTHLDVVAPLDAVRLPARLAGLDRSPGWIPRLGRVVLFHFR
jgi:hypothetical protein